MIDNTDTVDMESAFLGITRRLGEIIKEEDEQGLVEYVRQLTPKWDVAIVGTLRFYYNNQFSSFEWIMYVLSRHKGFEELVAKFFIGNYQITRHIFVEG